MGTWSTCYAVPWLPGEAWGGYRGGLCWVQGGQLRTLSLVSCRWQVDLVLPLVYTQTWPPLPLSPLPLVQVCGGVTPAATCCSLEATLPSARTSRSSPTAQGQA